MAFDQDVDIVTHCFTGGAHPGCGQPHLGRVHPLYGSAKGIEFDGLEAHFDRFYRRLCELFRRFRPETGVGIELDPVAQGAAYQLVDGCAEGFAFDIPQRLLDAADGAGPDRSTAPELTLVMLLPERFNTHRVPADQLHDADTVRHRQWMAIGRHLAQTVDARIGLDDHQIPQLPMAHDGHPYGLHFSNFHVRSSP